MKFLIFPGKDGQLIKRYEYIAIDDASRVRAPTHFRRYAHAIAIDFYDCVIQSVSFCIREVRTNNGHRFQALFNWHVEDQYIRSA